MAHVSAAQAERLVSSPNFNREVIHRTVTTDNIISVILEMDADPQNAQDVKALSLAILGTPNLSYREALPRFRQLWQFIRTNIRYQEDGAEQCIQSPAHLWASRKGDCKSFSLFAVSVGKALGYKMGYRFTAYDRDLAPGIYTHVYPFVVIDGKEIILDSVYHLFNQQKAFARVKNTMAGVVKMTGTEQGQTNQLPAPAELGNWEAHANEWREAHGPEFMEKIHKLDECNAVLQALPNRQDLNDAQREAVRERTAYAASLIFHSIYFGLLPESSKDGPESLTAQLNALTRKALRRKASMWRNGISSIPAHDTQYMYGTGEGMGDIFSDGWNAISNAGRAAVDWVGGAARDIAKAGKDALKWIHTAVTIGMRPGVINGMKMTSTMWLYMFITDVDIERYKFPEPVLRKRREQWRLLHTIWDIVALDKADGFQAIRTGIVDKTGKQPEELLAPLYATLPLGGDLSDADVLKGWQKIADEGQKFVFGQDTEIAFGADRRYVFQQIKGGVEGLASPDFFGKDPFPGVKKSVWFKPDPRFQNNGKATGKGKFDDSSPNSGTPTCARGETPGGKAGATEVRTTASGWQKIADEGQTGYATAGASLAFGIGNKWAHITQGAQGGTVKADSSLFGGDPAPGQRKELWAKAAPTGTNQGKPAPNPTNTGTGKGAKMQGMGYIPTTPPSGIGAVAAPPTAGAEGAAAGASPLGAAKEAIDFAKSPEGQNVLQSLIDTIMKLFGGGATTPDPASSDDFPKGTFDGHDSKGNPIPKPKGSVTIDPATGEPTNEDPTAAGGGIDKKTMLVVGAGLAVAFIAFKD